MSLSKGILSELTRDFLFLFFAFSGAQIAIIASQATSPGVYRMYLALQSLLSLACNGSGPSNGKFRTNLRAFRTPSGARNRTIIPFSRLQWVWTCNGKFRTNLRAFRTPSLSAQSHHHVATMVPSLTYRNGSLLSLLVYQ
jgi:hypothetical protein